MTIEDTSKVNNASDSGQDIKDDEFAARISARRKQIAAAQRRRKRLTVVLIIVAFALLGVMCGKDIVRLKAENRALKKQHAELEKQRDALKEELKNTGKQEYIRDQARKQLRLLNPGEILFTFGDEEGADAEDSKEEK